MKEIELCDFIVDELYSDSFAAVFAMEAVALGKPVIVGGYGGEELKRHIPAEGRDPNIIPAPGGHSGCSGKDGRQSRISKKCAKIGGSFFK